ncbi:MAG: hypothetical protein WBE18_05435 [Gammaproteobacteria bacterium]
MTNLNVPQNEPTENADREKIAFILELTNKEYRNLWRVILVGTALSIGFSSFF